MPYRVTARLTLPYSIIGVVQWIAHTQVDRAVDALGGRVDRMKDVMGDKLADVKDSMKEGMQVVIYTTICMIDDFPLFCVI